MKKLIACLHTSLLLVVLGSAMGAMADDYPVEVDVEAPHGKDGLPLLSDSGWPIVLEMSIRESDALGFYVNPNFPGLGNKGYIVFDDPDTCISWDFIHNPDGTCPEDETYLSFYADTDVVGVEDVIGDMAQRDQLVDSAGSASPEFQKNVSGPPETLCEPGTGSDGCDKAGPRTGGEARDGWGIGSDDDIPGLVLLSEAGIGIAFPQLPTPLFERPDPLVLRNLAGLNSFVSYELSTVKTFSNRGKGKKKNLTAYVSKVLVGFNVAPGMVRSILLADDCVGDPVLCEGPMLYRLDGGAEQSGPPDIFEAVQLSIELFDFTEFELSAFVVSGTAPAQLADEDGDGDVDSDDARLAGFTVLSNEVHFSVMQYDKRFCFGGGDLVIYEDLDGNGVADLPYVCPAGPGGLGRPPR